ncbi:MAG: histone deacetylase [Acidobacteriota bacterium]
MPRTRPHLRAQPGDRPRAAVGVPLTAPRVGIVFDERFRLHAAPVPHPERPERLAAIESHLGALGLTERCLRVPAREAQDAELLAIHTRAHVDTVDATARRAFTQLDPDTYASAASAEAARLAAGGLVDLVRGVVAGTLSSGLALVRPPGHHAESDRAMGFCLFNNVAIAARAAQENGAERILIVDWDLHHGNGTQNSFWDDPSVLYVSTHQAPLYPGTGAIEETGGPAAAGRTINVPWPAGRGDADHLAAFDGVFLPAARRFQPDVTIVSAGFDAARGDLLGSQLLSPGGYARMTERLRDLAAGRVVLALEGGYTLEAIAADAAACLESLLGDPPAEPEPGEASAVARSVLDEVIRTQRPHWPGVF